MKLKKNDLQELAKGGSQAIDAKLIELQAELSKTGLESARGKVQNVHRGKTIRRAIAQLKTINHQQSTKK
jgi:ribosomal protein L29